MHQRHTLLQTVVTALMAAVLLTACGTDGQHFKMEGRLLNFSQGELYVYSPDGSLDGLDTLKVDAGRFAYEVPCDRPMTLLLVFPNFTEQPVFAKPGASVDVKGNASHLKELTVKGTKDNELMNTFREQSANASPPEAVKYARQLIEDHPESPVGAYLVSKYFLQTAQPDYKEAARLTALMLAKQEDNGYLKRLQTALQGLANTADGKTLPAFSGHDTEGKAVSNATVAGAQVAVVHAWASWSYESMAIQRALKQLRRQSGGRMKLLSISLDAKQEDCLKAMKRDTIDWPNVWDGEMMDGRIVRQLGLGCVPDNLVLYNGRVVARGLKEKEMKEKVEELLRKGSKG